MFIGRIQGKIIVGYTSVMEMVEARSCKACTRYVLGSRCRFYSTCRADKREQDDPRMFECEHPLIIQDRFRDLRSK